MQAQYYSVLMQNDASGHFITIAAALTPEYALAEAIELCSYQEQHRNAVTLGVFAGLLKPLTAGTPLAKGQALLFTPSASEMDQRRASLHMLDDWTKLSDDLYVASISPPEELENELTPETVTLAMEDGTWWLSSSDTQGQGDYRFLEEAVIAANNTIQEIRARFQEPALTAA